MLYLFSFGDKIDLILEGPTCDMELRMKEWIQKHIGPIAYGDSIEEYDEALIKLHFNDFVAELKETHFRSIPFKPIIIQMVKL